MGSFSSSSLPSTGLSRCSLCRPTAPTRPAKASAAAETVASAGGSAASSSRWPSRHGAASDSSSRHAETQQT